jgi:hypothetical protein
MDMNMKLNENEHEQRHGHGHRYVHGHRNAWTRTSEFRITLSRRDWNQLTAPILSLRCRSTYLSYDYTICGLYGAVCIVRLLYAKHQYHQLATVLDSCEMLAPARRSAVQYNTFTEPVRNCHDILSRSHGNMICQIMPSRPNKPIRLLRRRWKKFCALLMMMSF